MTLRPRCMVLAILAATLDAGAPVRAEDCNRNGIEDRVDLEVPDVAFRLAGEVVVEKAHSLIPLDVDADQDLDLITLASSPDEIVTLENDGAGRFTAAGRIPHSLRILRSADLDGDADHELVGIGSGAVQILWNDGDGAFSRRTRLPIGSGPFAVETADLDGDGDMDLLTANFLDDNTANENVSVLLNEGGGTLSPPRNFAASHAILPALGVGDLDGDGDPDMAVASTWSGEIRVLENDGLARFRPAGPAVTLPDKLPGSAGSSPRPSGSRTSTGTDARRSSRTPSASVHSAAFSRS